MSPIIRNFLSTKFKLNFKKSWNMQMSHISHFS